MAIKIFLIENEAAKNRVENILKDLTVENSVELKILEDENELIGFFKKDPKQHFSNHIIIFNLKQLSENVFNVIQIIKEDSELNHIPIFVLTDISTHENTIKAYMCHVNCYIIKPEDLEGLISILNSFKELWLKHAELP